MINRSTARDIMNDVRAALESVAKKHNTTLGNINASYEMNGVRISVQFNALSDGGESLSREYQTLKRLYPVLAGETFFVMWQGKSMQVQFTGYNSNAPTYPILCNIDGAPKRAPVSLAEAAVRNGVPVKAKAS
jgi:hypothetical protein